MDYWTKYFGTGSPGFQIPDEEDMEEFRSEKSVQSGKTAEEIEKFLIDEKLSDLDRTCLLLSTGQDVQKLCVIENLPNLLRQHQMETLCRVIPKLCDVLPASSVDVQVLGSQVLGEAVQDKLIPVHIFISSCLPTVLKQLESRDQVLGRAWLGTILACISVLPKEDLKRKILTLAISKGQLSQTVTSRQTSCRIVGEIANRFGSESMWLKCEVLPLATALCQDVDSKVRQLMCQQLHALSKALGRQLSEESIVPELVELMNDEENQVRVSALEALSEMLTLSEDGMWSEDCLRKQVLPLVQAFYDAVGKGKDWVLVEGAARLLGQLCHGMRRRGVMEEEQLRWFVKCYCALQEREFPVPQGILPTTPAPQTTSTGAIVEPKTECRQLCAFNFPAMLLMVGKEAYKAELSSTFESLAHDGSWRVRKTIAAGFHEVVNILAEKALLVSHVYQSLLKDLSVEVLSGLVAHLPMVLKAFGKAANLSPDTMSPGLSEFIAPLLAFDQMASRQQQWRLHRDFIASLRSIVTCMTSDQIYSKFVHVVQAHITGMTVLPVKKAAGHTLCALIRNNRRLHQRTELTSWIIKELGKSQSCQNRFLFIEICTYLLELFSFNFFKLYFFETLLQLSQDPVINIRLRLFQLFPTLKSILKLPSDRVLLQDLELTVRKLIVQERDSDASQSIREAVLEMDRIEVTMETYTRRTYFETDLADQQKEMEEKMMLDAEEKDKLKPVEKVKKTKKGGAASPRELRKMTVSVAESRSTATPSPSLPHRTTAVGKSKDAPVSKTLSAPTSTADLVQAGSSPAHSPAHNRGSKSRKSGKESSKGSPPTGDRMSTTRNSSASSSASASDSLSQRILATTKSATGSMASPPLNNKSGHSKKKPPTHYGLEYSTKGPKKRT